ncbi:conserved hypothetical protein [Desulfamplus magnetovallimortis]|uniref:CRISPR-associated protein Cas6 C-terminal domain-containing protein n=1 Tax=Desulfamplus magnetovallimortis TaxID=1246637 RepID=A0A1W1HJ43_9BACT|nr:CRISPR system precrRNA processing endoribonuclease RAMP protein Cas6 [Desulfamplus magnetovallimortis]SLM32388.1 conserved hypothetical protein [Desulfamplus magnetovallimortis]
MIFNKYNFMIRLKDDAQLPFYKGSTFRGVMGHALKKVVCALKNQECQSCVLRSNCTYAMVFETAHAIELPKGLRISSAPHPLVLEPPETSQRDFLKGETLTCTLLFFGQINNNLPYFIYAFDQMGKIGIGKKIDGRRSRFVLESVTAGDDGSVVYTHDDQKIKISETSSMMIYSELEADNCLPISTKSHKGHERVTMNIITPLRIIARNAPVARLPFHLLISSIIRRNTALFNVYGEGEPKLDYPAMVEAAKSIEVTENSLKWLDWKRYSSRQDKKMFMGGLTGSITYQGDLAQFLPMMTMAETVHVGKNSAFGLGKITFRNDS